MDTTTGASPQSAVEKSAIKKVAVRLVPFVALMFFINYLDRTAIGFAAPNGMNDSLALSAAQFGFASGVFFIGYILLGGAEQTPSSSDCDSCSAWPRPASSRVRSCS